MSYSPQTYTGDGSTQDFAIPFQYQSEADIVVTVNGSPVSFTFSSSSVVHLTSVPDSGDIIRIERDTSDDSQIIIWNNAVALTSQQLNSAIQQVFFLAQEAKAVTADALYRGFDGGYDADGNRITNLDDPEEDQDAATRAFVEAYLLDGITNAGLSASTTPNDSDVTGDYVDDALNTLNTGKSDVGHTHDDRYYTESEIDSALAGKSDTSHTHDDRYYTEGEVDGLVSGITSTTDDHETRIGSLESVTTVFESSPQTITSGGLLTLPHGLSGTPRFITGRLVNVSGSTKGGWADGEGPMVNFGSGDWGSDRCHSAWADSTNVYLRYAADSNAFITGDKSDGSRTALNNGDWNLIVVAYL